MLTVLTMPVKRQAKYPELAKDLERRMKGDLPEGWKEDLPKFSPEVTAFFYLQRYGIISTIAVKRTL